MAGETEDHDDRERGDEPGRPERPRLRRSPLGYRRGDVDAALDARDSELAELRQDIAALWLAFAQHDRVLRALAGGASSPPEPSSDPATGPGPGPEPEHAPAGNPDDVTAEANSIGEQLAELDQVLAAIESATQTLERTYAEEIHGAGRPTPGSAEEAPDGTAPERGD